MLMIGKLFMNFSLKSVFEMINALQIVILLPLSESSVPANAGMFFERLAQIAAFDLIEIKPQINEYLDLVPTGPVNDKFESLGLESKYFINNLGTFFLIIMIYFLLVIIWIIVILMQKCKNGKLIKKLERKLNDTLFWNGLLEVVLESFLMVALCAYISAKYSLDMDSYG